MSVCMVVARNLRYDGSHRIGLETPTGTRMWVVAAAKVQISCDLETAVWVCNLTLYLKP